MAIFLTLLLFAAFTVLGELLRPKPDIKDAKPAGLGDFQFPTATENRKVPILWGTIQIKGPNVVWYGDLQQIPITQKLKTGLLSSKTIVKGYRYHVGIQFVMCAGPVDGLRRMWIKDELVVDGTTTLITHGDTFTIDDPDLFGGDDLGTGGFTGTFEFFGGTTAQTASSYLSTFQNEGGDSPAYRGYAHIAPATEAPYVGNSTSIDAPKFELQRITTAEANGLGLADPTVNSLDANPANVLYEIMVNTEWGMKIPAADIDSTVFAAAAATLKAEGNGFSFLLDAEGSLGAMLNRVETQIDGVVLLDSVTGKWSVKLARDDFDVATIPSFDQSTNDNIVEVAIFTKNTYEQTANVVSVEFVDRSDSYKTTFATAQNDANIEIQGGNLVFAGDRYPGVKDGVLADSIAWRDLRTESTPLAQARIVTDRTTYAVNPFDAVKVSFTARDFTVTDLVMRVKSIDRGELLDNRITYELVEDVFRAGAGGFGAPAGSDWVPPIDSLVPFPTTQQVAFEAPRALTSRDPVEGLATSDKIYASARQQGIEVSFDINVSHASASPNSTFETFGAVFAFCRIGNLVASLSVGDAVPRPSAILLDALPDTQANLLAVFANTAAAAPSPDEMGTALVGLVLCEEEFMLVSYATSSGGDVALQSVYRGALDSVQTDHAAGVPVFLIIAGGGLSDEQVPAGNNVDVKLLPRSYTDLVAEVDATTISFAMNNRTRRPYAPSEFDLNGVRFDSTNVDLDGSGTGEDVGVLIDAINRRDFRTENEVASLLNDAAVIASTFPAEDTTTTVLIVKNGATELVAQDVGTATTGTVRQLDILQALNTTTLPASLTFGARASHTFEGVVRESLVNCEIVSTIASPLIGEHAFGALDRFDDSTTYTIQAGDDATDHDFTLSSAFIVGDVQYAIDTGGGFGAWNTLIVAGGTTGAIPNASISVGDGIKIQHLSSDTAPQKLCTMTVAAAVRGYAVLFS